MSVLFKVAPPQDCDGDFLRLTAPPYGNVSLMASDRVFLWWSESQKGSGLVGHGLCVQSEQASNLISAIVEPVLLGWTGFGKAQLAPYRSALGDRPLHRLAAKLYSHSLNKVILLDQEEEGVTSRFVRQTTIWQT